MTFTRLSFITIVVMTMSFCKKDTITIEELDPKVEPKPEIKFVFVNRFGFRNDSVMSGTSYTIFQGPCLDLHYYDKEENVSHLDNTCYNRNFLPINFPTSDSVVFRSYPTSKGSRYAYQIELRWWKYSGTVPNTVTAARFLTYTTKQWPTGDTIKAARDTVIKFIWPDDTASGRYTKTYQWP